MAVAPLPNVRRVLDYALTEIPADKIFLGIPNYGYNWKLPYERGVTAAVTLGNLTAVDLAFLTSFLKARTFTTPTQAVRRGSYGSRMSAVSGESSSWFRKNPYAAAATGTL